MSINIVTGYMLSDTGAHFDIKSYVGPKDNIITTYYRIEDHKKIWVIEGELDNGAGFRTVCTGKHMAALRKDGYKLVYSRNKSR